MRSHIITILVSSETYMCLFFFYSSRSKQAAQAHHEVRLCRQAGILYVPKPGMDGGQETRLLYHSSYSLIRLACDGDAEDQVRS